MERRLTARIQSKLDHLKTELCPLSLKTGEVQAGSELIAEEISL